MADPTHIYQSKSGYVFRYSIPQDVRPFLGLSELRYSLRTGSIRTAKLLARRMLDHLIPYIIEIRHGVPHTATSIRAVLRTAREDYGQHGPTIATGGHPLPRTLVMFSELVQRYVDENQTWTQKTRQENEAIYDMFQRVVGDLPLQAVTRQVVSDYKGVLLRLPPALNKNPRFRDKTIAQLLELVHQRTTSPSTVNKHLVRLSTLFKFAVQNGLCDVNPATEMQIRINKRDDELRAAYSKQDLNKLFRSREYLEDDHWHSYQFWTPILGLYTGCRLEEICQLHLEDIRLEDGVWVLDINDSGDKRLKTRSSKRLIPLHSFLVDRLGIVRHAEELRKEGRKRLFPELSRRRDGYGMTVSKWFNERYKVKCGIKPPANGAKLDFHSFRHTFIDALKQFQVNPDLIRELDGHKTGDMTMDRYGKAFHPRTLLDDAISKLDFGFDHLASSRWTR